MVHLAKIQTSKSIDFLNFFAKRRKLLEKMSHQKKNRDYLARAVMYDVACEFACAVRMRRNS